MTFESEWARCAPWLQAALDRAGEGFDLEDVLGEVMAHRATFWPLRSAALVTEALPGDVAHVWLAGGSLRCILTMAPVVETRLAARGAASISIKGRRGWARALAPSGYRVLGDSLVKELPA